MSGVLFIDPAKMFQVKKGSVIQRPRSNVSVPALTVLGAVKPYFDVHFMDLCADGYDRRELIANTLSGVEVYRFGLPDDAVIERISELKPSALLVTSMFATEQAMVDALAEKVKRHFSQLPIIVGGAHASTKPEWLLESGNVNFVVLGEGEESIVKLLKSIDENCSSIKGIAYKKGSRVIKNPREGVIGNINLTWALEDVLLRNGTYRYDDQESKRSKIYSHMTFKNWTKSFSLYYSRGCPTCCYHCAASEKDGVRIRHMGAKRMFDDLKMLHEKYDVRIFYNQADTFGLREEDLKFLEMIKSYRAGHPDFVLNNPNAFFARIFFPAPTYELNEPLLELLAGAGFNVLTVAVETFSQRFNKKINFSRIPPEKIRELFEVAKARGLKTELYMMYAFPDQTQAEFKRDVLLAETMLDVVDTETWRNLVIFPGTEYYRRALKEGWFSEEGYRRHLKEGYGFYNLPEALNFSQIPTRELESVAADFNRKI